MNHIIKKTLLTSVMALSIAASASAFQNTPALEGFDTHSLMASNAHHKLLENESLQVGIETSPKSTLAGYTLDEVKTYAGYAQMAYAEPSEDGSHTKEWENYIQDGDRVHTFNTEIENSGMVIEHANGSLTVSYKGSTSLNNWATDAWANLAYDSKTGLRVHNGIMKGFYRTADQVLDILQSIAKKRSLSFVSLLESHTTITGHSLGGGLTQMLQAYLYKNFEAKVQAISFAAPRIFDISSAESLDKELKNIYLNVSQKGDPVPVAALRKLGYQHYGTSLSLAMSFSETPHLMTTYSNALSFLRDDKESSRHWLNYSAETTYWNDPYKWSLDYYRGKYVDPMVHYSLKSIKDVLWYGFSSVTNWYR